MATRQELIELGGLKADMKRVNDDIKEIKADVKDILVRFDQIGDHFPTRREINQLKWVIATLLTLVTAAALILTAVRTH